MLQKKKLWFIISIIVQVIMLLYGGFYDRVYGFLVVRMPVNYDEKILVLNLIGILGALYFLVYDIYRLVYLYRKTEARTKWTIINVCFLGAILLAAYDREFPLLSPFLTVHLFLPYVIIILGILCIWHDYEVIRLKIE